VFGALAGYFGRSDWSKAKECSAALSGATCAGQLSFCRGTSRKGTWIVLWSNSCVSKLLLVVMSNECVDCIDCGEDRAMQCETMEKVPTLYRQFAASSVGSATAVCILNPVTVVKVRLQSNPTLSLFDVVRSIHRDKLMRGFWAGMPVGLLQAVPNTIIYMSIYEHMKASFASSLPAQYSSVSPGLAGGLARIFCVTLMSPLEVLRTMQTGGARGSSMDIVRSIQREHGFGGFYRGWSSTIARDAPYSAIYWYSFDLLRPLWEKAVGRSPLSTPSSSFSSAATFTAGATASAIAAVCTHPFDVLKTRRQLPVDLAPVGAGGGGERLWQGLTALFRAEGMQGLYRGLSMRLATVIPGSAIVITVYEHIKNL